MMKPQHPLFYEGDLVIGANIYDEKDQHDLLESIRLQRPKLWAHVVNHGGDDIKKRLDEIFAPMNKFFGNLPMDAHIIQWAISKQDSFITAAMASYLSYRELKDADP